MNKSSTQLTTRIPSVATRSRIALPLSMLANRIGSTLTLLDGTASSTRMVTANFTTPPPPETIKLASDSVALSGTDTDPVVLQISYDPSVAAANGLAEAALRIGWLNLATGNWVNAVLG